MASKKLLHAPAIRDATLIAGYDAMTLTTKSNNLQWSNVDNVATRTSPEIPATVMTKCAEVH
jgi:hypothetical protein